MVWRYCLLHVCLSQAVQTTTKTTLFFYCVHCSAAMLAFVLWTKSSEKMLGIWICVYFFSAIQFLFILFCPCSFSPIYIWFVWVGCADGPTAYQRTLNAVALIISAQMVCWCVEQHNFLPLSICLADASFFPSTPLLTYFIGISFNMKISCS